MESTTMQNKSSESLEKHSSFLIAERPLYLSMVDDQLGDIYEKRNSLIKEITCGVVVTYRENNTAVKFKQYVQEVVEDCMMRSSITDVILHPSYQKIIGLGEKALPLLIDELRENNYPVFWFSALEAISAANPVQENHIGNVNKMIEDWISWAISNNYA